MNEVTLTYADFISEAKQFHSLSQKLGDTWMLHEKDGNEPNGYLSYRQKVKCKTNDADSPTTMLVNVEYHIVYSVSYQVPMLYFQAHRSDGSLLDIETTWRTFISDAPKRDLYKMLTQMDHPVLFRPFMALHPCRTENVLAQFGKKSRNRLLTFISLYGPHVQLYLQNAYGNLELLS